MIVTVDIVTVPLTTPGTDAAGENAMLKSSGSSRISSLTTGTSAQAVSANGRNVTFWTDSRKSSAERRREREGRREGGRGGEGRRGREGGEGRERRESEGGRIKASLYNQTLSVFFLVILLSLTYLLRILR